MNKIFTKEELLKQDLEAIAFKEKRKIMEKEGRCIGCGKVLEEDREALTVCDNCYKEIKKIMEFHNIEMKYQWEI